MLQISEMEEITKENFFSNIGMTSANFRGIAQKRALNSEAIEIIITKYPHISPEWLLTGKGSMLREATTEPTPEAAPKEKADEAQRAEVNSDKTNAEQRVAEAKGEVAEAYKQLAAAERRVADCRTEVIRLTKENAGLRRAKYAMIAKRATTSREKKK